MTYKKFTPDEIFFIPEIVKVTDNRWHAMDVSPEGTEFVFKWPISGSYELYTLPVSGGDPTKITDTPPSSQCVHPRYSPDGKHIAFLRDEGGNRRFRIWLYDRIAHTERILTEEPTVGADSRIEWSPDGTRLAYRPVDNGQGLWTIDVSTGKRTEIVAAVNAGGVAGNGALPSWSADSRFITYQHATEQEVNAGWPTPLNEKIFVVPSDGTADPWIVPTHEGSRAHALFPRFSPDGSSIAFTTDARGRFEVALVPVLDGRAVGDVRYLTTSKEDEYFLGWGQTGSVLYRRAVEATVLPHRYDLRTNTDEELASGRIVCYALREAKDGTVGYVMSSPTHPPEFYLKPQGRQAVRITESLPKGFDPSWLVNARHVTFPGADGVPIPAVLWEPKPEAAKAAGGPKPPAIVDAHGGGTRQSFQVWNPIAQWLCNNGYVVLAVNGRGSMGYGRDFRDGKLGPDASSAKPAGNAMTSPKAIQDFIKAADWLEASGIADGARIAMYGPSAGAQITIGAITEAPRRFAAGHAARGGARRIGDISKITVPLLYLGGKNDPMQDYREAEKFIAELDRQGKVHESYLYPDEGHGYRNPNNMRDAYTRMVRFFDKYVKSRIPTRV